MKKKCNLDKVINHNEDVRKILVSEEKNHRAEVVLNLDMSCSMITLIQSTNILLISVAHSLIPRKVFPKLEGLDDKSYILVYKVPNSVDPFHFSPKMFPNGKCFLFY